MIIPKEFEFSSDADAREKMTAYIRKHWGGMLGPRINLINQPNGLDLIEGEMRRQLGLDRLAKVKAA